MTLFFKVAGATEVELQEAAHYVAARFFGEEQYNLEVADPEDFGYDKYGTKIYAAAVRAEKA